MLNAFRHLRSIHSQDPTTDPRYLLRGNCWEALEELLSKRRAEALRNEMKKAKDERRDAAMVVNDVMEGWLFTTPRGRS